MAREAGIPKNAVIFGVALPMALMLGYLLAQPMRLKTIAVVGLVLGILLFPLLLRWHHTLLVAGWNAAIAPYLLPGQPDLWMLLVATSLPLTLLARTLDPNRRLTLVPSVAIPLLFIALVVIGTAVINGGAGFRSMGSELQGGRRYFAVLMAAAGFFAMSWVPVPKDRRKLLASCYFLAAGTAIFSDVAYVLGPSFYFLYSLFPVGVAAFQIQADFSAGDTLVRFAGASIGASGCMFFMCLHWGIRGILDLTRPWRLGLFMLAFGVGLMGGFRSLVLIVGSVFVIQFILEGLHKTRHLFVVLAATLTLVVVVTPFVDKLPRAAQRAISIIPGAPVDKSVVEDARISSDWRVEMWRVLWPEVPQHFWEGKGYAMNASEFYLAQAAARRGILKDYEPFLISGEYHSGLLTLIIPLGVWGLLGFLLLLGAGIRVLYRNYRYGDPEIKLINTLLLAYFLTKTLYYFGVFGSFYSELYVFTGLLGLSVSLNHGVCGPPKHDPIAPPKMPLPPAPGGSMGSPA